ncbi:hypothetical protein MNBD_GAMMA13-174, partial [hydrothermal vent metagenome]
MLHAKTIVTLVVKLSGSGYVFGWLRTEIG